MAHTHKYLGWTEVTEGKNPVLHVIPVNDTMDHCFEDCWCVPFQDGDSIVHNSHDHREDYSEFGRKMN